MQNLLTQKINKNEIKGTRRRKLNIKKIFKFESLM